MPNSTILITTPDPAEQNNILLWTSIFAFGLTTLGSLILYYKYRKIPNDHPLANLIMQTGWYDFICAAALFMNFNVTTNNVNSPFSATLGIVASIAGHMSLVCICLVSSIYHFKKRHHQVLFYKKYKLWLLVLFAVVTVYDIGIFFTNFLPDWQIGFYLYWLPVVLMEVFIIGSNLKLMHLMKMLGLQISDKLPYQISLITFVMWMVQMVGFYIYFIVELGTNFWLFVICNAVNLGMGFVNFLIGIKRMGHIADLLPEKKPSPNDMDSLFKEKSQNISIEASLKDGLLL